MPVVEQMETLTPLESVSHTTVGCACMTGRGPQVDDPRQGNA